MNTNYKNHEINNIDDILNMDFYNGVCKKKYFWWNVAAIFFNADISCIIFGLWHLWKFKYLPNWMGFLFIILFFFAVLFAVIGKTRCRRVWKIAFLVLHNYKVETDQVIEFEEYDKNTISKKLFPLEWLSCIILFLLVFALIRACGLTNNDANMICLFVTVWGITTIIPWCRGLWMWVDSIFMTDPGDFLIYIHRREKIRNAKKESKTHK